MLQVIDGSKASIEARRRNAICSRLLLLRLQKFHSNIEASHPARYPLPSPIVGNPLVDIARKRWSELGSNEGSLIVLSEMPTVDTVINTVCRYFGIEIKALLSKRRTTALVRPRQIAMYLAADMTAKSLPTIGRHLNRDHTTILYGRDLIARMIAADPVFAIQVLTIRKQIEVWTSLTVPAPEIVRSVRRQYDVPSKWNDESSRILADMKASGFNYGVIAQKLGVSKTACKSRYLRMRKMAEASVDA